MARSRYLAAQTREDLKHRMVFVAGARQVGKTTFARSLPGAAAGYLKMKFPECAAWQLHAQGSRDYQTPEGIRGPCHVVAQDARLTRRSC